MITIIYIASICLANLSAAKFGIWITPINAFFLIGLELTLRDILHHKLSKLRVCTVIFIASLLSYVINIDSKNIAIASSASIFASCIVDYFVYAKTKGSWSKRSNTSNFYSGISDSAIFPVLAFGVFVPQVFMLQWSAKFFGGMVWIYVISRIIKKN